MDISIIVPTKDREEMLRFTLQSILKQTRLPREVIIVDDSRTNKTKYLSETLKPKFAERGLALSYIRNTRSPSLTTARNIPRKMS